MVLQHAQVAVRRQGVITVVMQRVHLNDLSGYLLKTGKAGTLLDLAAIAEEDEEIEIGRGKVHRRRAGEALHPSPSMALTTIGRFVSLGCWWIASTIICYPPKKTLLEADAGVLEAAYQKRFGGSRPSRTHCNT